MMILEDKIFIDEIKKKIEEVNVRAEYALYLVINEKIAMFNELDDPYLKERATDIRDIGEMVIRSIKGIPYRDITNLNKDTIIVTANMTPSQIVNKDKKHINGIVMEVGGSTSHIAILAKSMEIPGVIGVNNALEYFNEGELLVVDGDEGAIICGELAGDSEAVPLLIGLGLDELSVNPSSILKVRNIVNSLDMDKAKKIAENILGLKDPKEIKEYLRIGI